MRDYTKLAYDEVFSMEHLQQVISAILNNWWVKVLTTSAFSMYEWLFHPRHDLVTVVFLLVAFDTITGLAKAFRNHTVSSSGFFRFALKIVVYSILLATGAALDKITPLSDIISGLTLTATFLTLTEALSILENVAALGFAVPLKLVSLLKFAQQAGDKTGSVGKAKELTHSDKAK